MGWPQIILLCMWAVGIGVHAAKNGEPMLDSSGRPCRYNCLVRLIATLIWVGLLYLGGFFDP